MQRFRRLRRGEERAVSPVVATLILILIAVAAAAALYLWLVAWQGGVTAGIGSPGAQATLTIGGSTSVYPFASQAATWFEANNSDVVISVNQGGSGAGMAAVCSGQVNIGEASTYYGTGLASSPSAIQTSYGCPATVAVEVVAYDGVDPIVATTNTHALQNLSWDTLQAIYVDASSTPASSGSNIYAQGAFHMDGVAAPVQPAQGAGYTWNEIPACAAGVICGSGAGAAAETTTGVTVGAGITCTVTGITGDICASTYPTGTSPCGYTVCAGGANNAIKVYYRSDVSGTTQSFIARDLAVSPTSLTPNPLNLGFSGCSGDNQFDGCGLTMPSATGANGNPGVIQAVAGSPDGIGYASDGLAQAGGSNVLPVNFQGYGQSVVVKIVGESAALKAIALGIADHEGDSASYATSQAYVGWRPFLNVETAPPTGEALRYLQFVMDPGNNEAIAAATAEISVYASGLAGVVPVTPIP
jgi:flagellin-like protein